jgi:hypothetical protein
MKGKSDITVEQFKGMKMRYGKIIAIAAAGAAIGGIYGSFRLEKS